MSTRDENPFSFPNRHLRLVIDDDAARKDEIPVPMGRLTRKIRPAPRPKVNTDLEVPISHSTDLSDGAGEDTPLSLAKFPATQGAGEYSQLATICRRIAEGYYNSPEVLDRVARRILASGFLKTTSTG